MQPGVTFREILPADIEAIFDVRVRTWHNPHGARQMQAMGITHDSVCQMLQKSHRGWLAERAGAEHNNQVIGFTIGDSQTGQMWVIAVLPEFKNQGIGRALMKRVEDWLIAEGCTELWLTTDTDDDFRAVGFYRRLGWEDWKFEAGDRFMKKRIQSGTD